MAKEMRTNVATSLGKS